MQTVIFACVHNAGRSQMAAAFFNKSADPTKARAISAGTEPGPRVHPEVLEVMREVGIDLSHAQPQLLTEDLARTASLLITMGCGDKCPYLPGLRRDDWPLSDPKGRPIDEVRHVRDEIQSRVAELITFEHLEDPILCRPAEERDRVRVSELLVGSGLAALDDAAQFGPQYTIAVLHDDSLVGIAGVECYGEFALLRSVAVASKFRKQGLGRRLTEDRLSWSARSNIKSVYLLTTTARQYWSHLGFEEIAREEAPASIRSSHEWASGCPASATAMRALL